MIENVYGAEESAFEDMMDYLNTYGGEFKDYICDTGVFLREAAERGDRIMFEAQLGALRDIDFGIYPYTSSSSTIAAYAPIGAGIPGIKLDSTVGIMKAYSSCVGEGPFTVETKPRLFARQAESTAPQRGVRDVSARLMRLRRATEYAARARIRSHSQSLTCFRILTVYRCV